MQQSLNCKRRKANLWQHACGLACLLVMLGASLQAQNDSNLKKVYSGDTRPRQVDFAHDNVKPADFLTQAVSAVCRERALDPFGSVPIDVMQSRDSLPLKNSGVLGAARRAEQLLPIARELAVESLLELGRQYKIEDVRLRAAAARIQAVTTIDPDVSLRDNASVSTNLPTVISFGTIFLVGLPSNEGMVSVLAHELTHLGDGKEDSLQPLFVKIGRLSSGQTGMHIVGRRAEELTCDLIGTMAVRKMIARTPSRDPLTRRLARAIGHNCVEYDETDEAHLSPRSTLRAVLAFDKALAQGVLGGSEVSFRPSGWLGLTPPDTINNAASLLYASQYCRSAL